MPAFVSGCIKHYQMLLCRMTADRKGLEIFFHLKNKLLPPKVLDPHFQESPSPVKMPRHTPWDQKNLWDGFSAFAKYKIFVPDLLELHTQLPQQNYEQRHWTQPHWPQLHWSTGTHHLLKVHNLPAMCTPGEDRGVKEDLAIILHMYGRKASCRVWCSEFMALPYWV